ncbi:MAG: group 1 glycosyl [Beijerinckiaceae bacterium]|nr:MAG: group 1 glycosyl [Beijerinckiaceae bacterium]
MPKAPLRFLLLNGVVNKVDAISRSLILKHEALREFFGQNALVDVACYGGDADLQGMNIFRNSSELIRSDVFRDANCLIYEFGICYDLFDSIHVAPRNAAAIGVWHNVTPPSLAYNIQAFNTLKISLTQSTNLFHCDHIFCDSQYNLDEISPLDPSYRNISVLNLPIEDSFLHNSEIVERHNNDKCLQFLFVGRFVRSKGVLDLIVAFTRATRKVPDVAVNLVLVGNTSFSEDSYLNEITTAINNTGNRNIHFAGTASQDELLKYYTNSDVFIMPSYHEGYCVPVLEAFASGCHVIAYDAGNLSAIVGDYGHTVPTGDVEALTEALADYLMAVGQARRNKREPSIRAGTTRFSARDLSERARLYAISHSIAAYKKNFIAGLGDVIQRKGLWIS